MKKLKLYTTPFIVAWVMLFLGLAATFNLAYIPLIFENYDGMGGGFAVAAVGVLLIIVAICIFGMYGKLESDFQKMLKGETFLSYLLPPEIYKVFAQSEAEDIKSNNKVVLFLIIGFSVLFGVIFTLITESPLFIIIFICMDVFFVIVYFVTTAYRTGKVKKSQVLVCLSAGGAYVFGQMHSWTIVGAMIISVNYFDNMQPQTNLPCGYIQVTYTAVVYPVPRTYTVTIPVPPQYFNQAVYAVNALKSIYGI